ncbi:hypothetical protein J2Y58_003129 [Sphingomonas sp. BE138]|uniref:hypothetical protein n=1 Tax=unclassified Sphingomonas TaxID=196159 RepID=UPI000AB5840E|nr:MULTISPECIES: hypothetical protein [unclassified Sphingomonas]MDR6789754.1 hypothetical protein [Sphingomonas sp. BE138]RSU60272.1 hypothetical protein BRX36_18730 [Sphingomonas sp. S-NIH.Pt1_0416]
MRAFAILASLTVAACGGRHSPTIVAANVEGISALRQVGGENGELVRFDLAERWGSFRLRDQCLVLQVDGTSYTPVFAGFEAERLAITDARETGRSVRRWSIAGAPIPPETGRDQRARRMPVEVRSSSCAACLAAANDRVVRQVTALIAPL